MLVCLDQFQFGLNLITGLLCYHQLEISLCQLSDFSFFFIHLHGNFQKAFKEEKITTCFLIQAILIEAFAISAYHVYIRVAAPFAKKITEGVVKDEYLHLNYGQEWLKAKIENIKFGRSRSRIVIYFFFCWLNRFFYQLKHLC